MVLVSKIELLIISVLWVNNKNCKEIIKNSIFGEDIHFSEKLYSFSSKNTSIKKFLGEMGAYSMSDLFLLLFNFEKCKKDVYIQSREYVLSLLLTIPNLVWFSRALFCDVCSQLQTAVVRGQSFVYLCEQVQHGFVKFVLKLSHYFRVYSFNY